MYKLLAISALLLSSPALSTEAPSANPQVWKDAQPQVRVSVRPDASAGSFDVSVVITDRISGIVLAEPRMSIKAGSWAQAEIGPIGVPGVASVALSVTVDPSGKNAAYFAEILRPDGRSESETGTLLIAYQGGMN